MGMNALPEVLGTATELEDRHGLGNQFGGAKADNLCSQQFVSFRIRQDFRKTLRLVIGQRSPVRYKREFTDLDGNSPLFGKILRETDARDLRVSINDIRDRIIVYMSGFSSDSFDTRYTLVLSFMGEHRSVDHIPYGIEARDI